MTVIRPTHHPITGELLPRRTVLRRISDIGILADPGPYFETVDDEAENTVDVRMGRAMRAYLNDRSLMRTTVTFPVRGSGSGRMVSAIGIHVSGLRAGLSGTESPAAPGDAVFSLALTDDRTSGLGGIALSHYPGDDYAFIRNSLTGTSHYLDGSDGQAISLRTHRSQSVGLLADFTTGEAQVYSMNALGDITVRASLVLGAMINDAADDTEIRPQLTLRNFNGPSGGPVRATYTRLDVDIWTD